MEEKSLENGYFRTNGIVAEDLGTRRTETNGLVVFSCIFDMENPPIVARRHRQTTTTTTNSLRTDDKIK